MKINLKVWRQKCNNSQGKFKIYQIDNVLEDMSFFEMLDMLNNTLIKKGDVFQVANIAGIQGAKKTDNLIPLCHSLPLSYGNGTFELDVSQNPYGDFKEGDGISDHIQGGVSLVIDVTNSGDGKSLMNAQLVRNMDSEPTTPVDQIKVKDKG